ncbi:M23 family metallopeptidase [Lysobacter gummosus]|uniref:M23 family metallopeptidase n=2 Tax=Lysobacter gummosus TaxID=262324 RepID=A0ABY3XCW4_9GAMM|nr:M23 family metallopeptidase [Lysobacter gummosus]UNP28445.1 M23 family metallopeptidase [Lysobacter gummosus]
MPGFSVRLAVALSAALALPSAFAAAPKFQMPFPCKQVWHGNTRENHSPKLAVDLSRSNGAGDKVVAAAKGRVSKVRNLGNTSYGKYVVIDHGGGWSTLYAHLNSYSVKVGDNLALGQGIGTVGNTGTSFGAHLHHEQLLNGALQKIKFNGAQIHYFDGRDKYTDYKSANSCP